MNVTSRRRSASSRPKPLVAGLAIALNLSMPVACFATHVVTTCADSGLGSLRAAADIGAFETSDVIFAKGFEQ